MNHNQFWVAWNISLFSLIKVNYYSNENVYIYTLIIVIIVFFVSVSGLGFGILSGAFSTVNVLADMVGPGTIGIYGDSKYFFVATGNCSVTKFYICVLWTKCTLPFPRAFQYLFYKCLKIKEHLNLPVAVGQLMNVDSIILQVMKSKKYMDNWTNFTLNLFIIKVDINNCG